MTFPRRRWVDREFAYGRAADELPDLLERVRGTPARLEERRLGVPTAVLTSRQEGRWSIQENVGHLLDLSRVG